MHIKLVIYGSLDILTGGFIYDRYLAEALRRRGHRVEVAGLPRRPYPLSLADNFSPKLQARLSAGRWDLLLQDALCHPSLWRLNRCLRTRSRPPIVGIVHQVLCRQPRSPIVNRVFRWVESRYLRTVDGLLFTSRATCRLAEPLIGAVRPHQVAAPGGDRLGRIPSAALIDQRSRSAGPLEVLFVGNLSPVKGLHRLLESLARLPRHIWRLTVAGSLTADRAYSRRIRSALATLNLTQPVRCLGLLEGTALCELFVRSHVFAMPFAHEGFGIAALEAMAFGLPVIGSASGGAGEFVRHQHNGFLVAPSDRQAVGRHLELLHHDRKRLAAMGRAALDTFLARPTWDESMELACRFLENAVSGWMHPAAGGNSIPGWLSPRRSFF
jgi:glycosyltransferase involved in cell wall biosynthesis